MMTNIYKIGNKNKWLISASLMICHLSVGVALLSCSDFSDYNEVRSDAVATGNQTLWENIQQNSQLSDFAALVKKAGFDDELNQSHYYTVWAPLNNTFDASALQQLDSKALLRQFVLNHVADYGHNATGTLNERIHMLNGKSYNFVGTGSYTFDNVVVSQPNQPSNNGVMHLLNGAAVYYPNLYDFVTDEQLSAGKDIDSLRAYFQKYELTYLDTKASVVGPIVNGVQTYIDSVMITENTLNNTLRTQLDHEDSTYTFVLPVNDVWNSNYERIKRYYNYIPTTSAQSFIETNNTVTIGASPATYTIDDVAYLKDSLVKRSLVNNLVFSNNDGYNQWVEGTASYLGSDTLRTTTRNKLSNPRDILNPAYMREKIMMSNGYGRLVDSIAIYPWEWYVPERSFDTRSNTARVATGNAHSVNVTLKGYDGMEFAKDGSLRYVWAEPNGGYSKPEIDVYLPNVLSTTYNFYCVFVPERFDNAKAENLPNRVNFALSYCDETGTLKEYTFLNESEENIEWFRNYTNYVDTAVVGNAWKDADVIADNKTNSTTIRGFSNDPLKVDTVFIGQFTFPVSYYGLGTSSTMICPNIKITSPMSVFNKTLMAAFSRDLRIAAILAKPVELVEYEESNKQ